MCILHTQSICQVVKLVICQLTTENIQNRKYGLVCGCVCVCGKFDDIEFISFVIAIAFYDFVKLFIRGECSSQRSFTLPFTLCFVREQFLRKWSSAVQSFTSHKSSNIFCVNFAHLFKIMASIFHQILIIIQQLAAVHGEQKALI